MELQDLQKVWDDWAQVDPMWAILSNPAKRRRGWDPDEFFTTGREEVGSVMVDLAARGLEVKRHRCLDFGCGIGRLTRALAEYFEVAEGVDIAPSMIRQAQDFNSDYVGRCRFHVNDRPDLAIFADKSFDFIYSNIVLQHLQPDLSEGYIREFLRILSDGGLAVFQVPSRFTGPPPATRLKDDSHLASLTLERPVPPLVANTRYTVSVRVRNESKAPWPETCNIRLGNHWWKGDYKSLLSLDDGRTSVGETLLPGGTTVLDLGVTTPPERGRYILELDLVEEAVTWFAERGSSALRVPVEVRRPPRARHLLTRKRAASAIPDVENEPRMFEMHALSRERVVAAVEEGGGEIVDIESYNPAGSGWESYRYYVTIRTRRP